MVLIIRSIVFQKLALHQTKHCLPRVQVNTMFLGVLESNLCQQKKELVSLDFLLQTAPPS
jgi:hypothetical protein